YPWVKNPKENEQMSSGLPPKADLRSTPYAGSRVGQLCGHLGNAITDDDAAQVNLHCASTPSAAARRRCPIAGPRVAPSLAAQLGLLKLELVYLCRVLVATFLP